MHSLLKTGSGYYKIRLRVAKELLPFIDRLEINKSLKTKKLSEAKVRATRILDAYQTIKAYAGLSLATKESLKALCDELMFDIVGAKRLATDKLENFKEYRDYSSADTREFKATAKFRVSFGKPSDVEISSINASYEDTKGAIDGVDNSYSLDSNYSSTSSQAPKQPLQTNYSKLIDDFCNYYSSRKEVSKNTRDALTSFLRTTFKELIGSHSIVVQTNLNDLITLKAKLSKLPSKNYKQYKGKSIEKLLALDIPQEHRLSEGRLQSYIKYIKQLYKFAMASRIIIYNPAEYLTIRNTLNPIDEREAYTAAEVRSVLNIADTLDNSKRIIYYTLAYSGMRLSELWKCSIKELGGIYYFDLKSSKEQLKTKSSYRLIPLHKELLRIGVQDDFSKAIGEYKRVSIMRYFERYIKPLISDNKRKVLYSLRHSFATELKYKGVDSHIISELLGHSHQGMTFGRYASRYPLRVLKAAIDELEYPP